MLIENYVKATDVGLRRENNEDAVFGDSQLGLWLVADGMGGHEAGEVASDIARATISLSVKEGKSLAESVQLAHHAILAAVEDGIGKYGMGCTVVAMQSSDDRYRIAWVGDSRAYLFSPAESSGRDKACLEPLSTDHSYVQLLFQSGVITEQELNTHPDKNIITQCLGSNETDEVDVDVLEGTWQSKQQILLCSDGLSDIVTDEEIKSILSHEAGLEQSSSALIQAVLDRGGKDNISVVLVEAPPNIPEIETAPEQNLVKKVLSWGMRVLTTSEGKGDSTKPSE